MIEEIWALDDSETDRLLAETQKMIRFLNYKLRILYEKQEQGSLSDREVAELEKLERFEMDDFADELAVFENES